MIGLNHYLLLGAFLFVCGVVCMASKRNAIGVLMGVELVLNGATINFVAFAHFNAAFVVEGQIFALFVIVLAAAEEDQHKRQQRQQRGGDEEQAGLCIEVGHGQPFSSSAVSTSTVAWLL